MRTKSGLNIAELLQDIEECELDHLEELSI
jgi:hypothetical protein